MSNHTTTLRFWISRHAEGDARATNELLRYSERRFLELVRARLPRWDRIRRFEDSDAVLNLAMSRFVPAIRATPFQTLDDFLRLGARVIRNQICDLADHYFGPNGAGTREPKPLPGDSNGSGPAIAAPPERTLGAEIEEAIALLPQEHQEMFDLLYYDGMTQAEAAEHLGVSDSTVRRRWLLARVAFIDRCPRDDTPDFPDF